MSLSGGIGGTLPGNVGVVGGGLPSGGTTGQALVKSSNASYDVGWATQSGGITALTGDVTASGTGSVAATIASRAVTAAKLFAVTAQRLLGRHSLTDGSAEEIALGSGLALDTGTLDINATSAAKTFLAANTSANLRAMLSDETGTGAAVFANSPVFTTPNIGSATGSVSGSAATLATPRTINGTSFDGSANITLPPLGAPPPLEGVWMMPYGVGGSLVHIAGTLTQNLAYLRLYTIGRPCTLKTVKWAKDTSIGSPCAGKNLKVLVYSCGSDGWPDTLLHTSAATALSDSSGETSVTVNLAITGNVWIGVVLDSTVTYTGGSSEAKYYTPSNTVYAGYLSSVSLATQRSPCVSYSSGSYASPDSSLAGETKTHLASAGVLCLYAEFSA